MTNRRHLARLLVGLLLATGALAGCRGATGAPDAAPAAVNDGPNIVLITTDDQTLAEMRWLPETRRLLGDDGVTFTDFVAPQPLCCPSRAQILTGQYAQNNGVRHNSGRHGGYDAFEPESALPVWLQSAGYQTAFVGKYLNGYSSQHGDDEAGWDSWDPTLGGVYDYVGFRQVRDGAMIEPGEYHTDYVARRSEDLVTELGADDEPFFLWASLVAPHGTCRVGGEVGCANPPRPAKRYRTKFKGADLPFLRKPGFGEPNLSDKPSILRQRPPVDRQEMRRLGLERIRALASVDDAVAGIVDSLRESGELDDTVLVFTSDNGYLLGQHNYVGKTLAYEESVRVPLLVRGPGFEPGTTRTDSTAMIDLAPTFAQLAGAAPLVEVDGMPLTGAGPGWPGADPAGETVADAGPDRTVLVQAGAQTPRQSSTGWMFRGVRTGRYTYVRWSSEDFVELYDRKVDPHQLRNVAGLRRYDDVRAELSRRTDLLEECAGDTCRTSFGPVPKPTR